MFGHLFGREGAGLLQILCESVEAAGFVAGLPTLGEIRIGDNPGRIRHGLFRAIRIAQTE
jgi:hypothetical protein